MADTKASGDKKPKKVMPPRPVFVVMQIVGDDGQPVAVNKDNVRIITASRNASEVLDTMESGSHPGAFYKKVPLGK